MKNDTIVMEKMYKAPIEKVWKALTDKTQMKEWYFDLDAFKPEVGFEFSFSGKGSDGVEYIHLCKITEVIEGRKIAYSWTYKEIEGYSEVSFELFPEGEYTKLILTHKGISSFKTDNPDFGPASFNAGWTAILGKNLPGFLEK